MAYVWYDTMNEYFTYEASAIFAVDGVSSGR